MKKYLLLVMAFGLAACQTDKTDVNGGLVGDGEPSFLSVSIVAQPTSRADGFSADDGKQYEDGEGQENDVKNVRFFFFDGSGNAAVISADGKSYLDVTPGVEGNDHPNSVEKILNAVVVINTKDKTSIPSSIIAVINPTEALEQNLSISQLNEKVANYSVKATKETGFIMSNSVYATGQVGTGETKVEQVLIGNHLHATKGAAELDPVVIYVERVVAKVGLTISLSEELKSASGNYYKVNRQYENGEAEDDDTEVYLEVLGWNVTSVTTTSNLMKDIASTWSPTLFGAAEPWNWAGHRSFWAINPDDVEVAYGKFKDADDEEEEEEETPGQQKEDDATPSFITPANALQPDEYTYIQENAAKDATGATTDTPTKVIIAARLVDNAGNPLTLAKYAGTVYKGTDDVKQMLASAANVYTMDGDSYNSILPAELDFATASTVESKTPEEMANDNQKRYYVYPVIIEEEQFPANKYYSRSYDEEQSKYVYEAYTSYQEINDSLNKLGHVMVWDEGLTYYYFNIRHLGAQDTPGYYGVVRNHIYKNSVTKIEGLGTPVYDPTEDIIPEQPEDDDIFVAAQVEILSWRVVNNNGIQLEW